MTVSSETSQAGDSPSSRAAEYIAHDRFHRRFILPVTPDHGELQVSYADVGRTPKPNDDDTQHSTILFIPGMFASRYVGVGMHAIAEKLGVRVLVIDRPGMGHSTDVPLHQRVDIWVELVPLFLAHLQIKHVALASHSAGTIYLFNTLLRCRDILHPTTPLVALIAPWVDPAHSHVATMQLVQYLPTSVFGVWHQIPKFAAAGGAVFNEISKLLPSSSGLGNAAETRPLERNRQRIESDYWLDLELQKELATLSFKAIFDENTAGANSEALQCLRKGPAGLWGDCEDYRVFVGKLSELERGQGGRGGEKLRICAYFAERDALIGKKGQSYMENCWESSGEEEFRDVLKFTTTTISETDHDSVVQSVECLEQIFISAGGSMPASP